MTRTQSSPVVHIDMTDQRSVHASGRDTSAPHTSPLDPLDGFIPRHIGPNDAEVADMLAQLGYESLSSMIDEIIPASIQLDAPLGIGEPMGERAAIASLKSLAEQNEVFRSYLGMGYHDCIVPGVIQRNILENPGWYTQYTPYQAEISQGRLEALLNFQTMVADLTGLPLAGASLLDEATAAAEAMAMCVSIVRQPKGSTPRFFIADTCHPQTIAVCQTRATSMGIRLEVGPYDTIDLTPQEGTTLVGVLLQYPTTDGAIVDPRSLVEQIHDAGAMCVMAADILALALVAPPGELGADIAIGSTQRFGVPMGYGGPHAAYLSTREKHARKMPGRIIGVSRDAHGRPAYRMAIQTREQHIKRERATSNICTAQALLAIMSGMYAVYHGPDGIRGIATRVNACVRVLATVLQELGHSLVHESYFDTLRIKPNGDTNEVLDAATTRRINLRRFDDDTIGIALDETVSREDLIDLCEVFGGQGRMVDAAANSLESRDGSIPADLQRTSAYLEHPVFNTHHSETEMLRYIFALQGRDLSLAQSMIPLGSCTMKLNATSEMLPVTWPEFGALHPFAPASQAGGYATMFEQLEDWLRRITGFAAISLQPNAGSQGEYSGLLAIRGYHESRGDHDRKVCLIPTSAHGTNPASAIIAGFEVVTVACDAQGNVDLDDLRQKAQTHAARLGALMITYPSTHGVFEEDVKTICAVIHENGGQVYMDGANMNAQVGLTSPATIGADVCHLNLHKTFCIPHGGGGPGMGPIGVGRHLAPFLPGDPLVPSRDPHAVGPVAAAPYGSPSILTISWMYIAMMGDAGLTRATEVAILNANYMAHRLKDHYDVLFTGASGRVGHEFIVDCRMFEKTAGIKVEDIAKRLMDYGFHAPTMSFPVAGTLMIEPTESESKDELERLCDALIQIRQEIRDIEEGRADREDNVLLHSPHTISAVSTDDWTHPYSRESAAFPLSWLRDHKFWPCVGRIDNPYGDRNLMCTCPPMSTFDS